MRALRLGLVMLCVTALVASVRAEETPPSWDGYWTQIESARSLIESANPDVRAQLLPLADQFAAIPQVRLPDGTLLSLDHSFLVAELRADPADLPRLKNLLDTLLAARPSQPQANARAGDLAALTAILARPEFQWPVPQPSLLERLLRWLFARLWELSRLIFPAGLDPSVLGRVLTILGILALVVVLALVGRSLMKDLVTEAEAALAADTPALPLTAETALKQAQRKAATGDYRAAIRYLYLSSLLSLEERGLLRYDRSQTNREYVRKVAGQPEIAAPLQDVVEVFDRVWYGFQPVDQAEYDRYADRVADLRGQK